MCVYLYLCEPYLNAYAYPYLLIGNFPLNDRLCGLPFTTFLSLLLLLFHSLFLSASSSTRFIQFWLNYKSGKICMRNVGAAYMKTKSKRARRAILCEIRIGLLFG